MTDVYFFEQGGYKHVFLGDVENITGTASCLVQPPEEEDYYVAGPGILSEVKQFLRPHRITQGPNVKYRLLDEKEVDSVFEEIERLRDSPTSRGLTREATKLVSILQNSN